MSDSPILRYVVYKSDCSEFAIGEIFAKSEDEAMQAWLDFMVDGPTNVKLVEKDLSAPVVNSFV